MPCSNFPLSSIPRAIDETIQAGTLRIKGSGTRVGIIFSDTIADVTTAAGSSLLSLFDAGDLALAAIEQAAASAPRRSLASARLLAPVTPHVRLFDKEQAAESNMKTQAVPTVFMKLASSVAGPKDDIILPVNSTEPDYEAEFAVVIGQGGFRIPASEWDRHVFGYTIVNDVSARDVQLATSQWTLGKSFPTFTPVGPYIVTKNEVPDPHALDIKLTIDG